MKTFFELCNPSLVKERRKGKTDMTIFFQNI